MVGGGEGGRPPEVVPPPGRHSGGKRGAATMYSGALGCCCGSEELGQQREGDKTGSGGRPDANRDGVDNACHRPQPGGSAAVGGGGAVPRWTLGGRPPEQCAGRGFRVITRLKWANVFFWAQGTEKLQKK